MERHKCRSCEEHKDSDEYWHYTESRTGRKRRERTCKVCRTGERLARGKSLQGFLRRKVSQLRSSRKKQGVHFHLTWEDCVDLYKEQEGKCALSGIVLEYGTPHLNKWDSNNISIDRIDTDGPYSKDNVQLVCASINFMRGRLSLEVFIRLCGRVNGRRGNDGGSR